MTIIEKPFVIDFIIPFTLSYNTFSLSLVVKTEVLEPIEGDM